MGLLCAFGWQSRAQYWHSAVDLVWLSSEKRSEKNIDGNPKNIHGRFNRESHPCRKTRAPERDGKATIDCIVPSKECFDLAADFDPSLDERNYLPLSVGVMFDISGCGAEACVSS